MNARMQRLDPAVHHLGEAGQFRRVLDRMAGLRQRARRAAGRDKLDASRRQGRAQFDEAGFVRNRNQGAADPRQVASHGNSRWEGREDVALPDIVAARYHGLPRNKTRRRRATRRAQERLRAFRPGRRTLTPGPVATGERPIEPLVFDQSVPAARSGQSGRAARSREEDAFLEIRRDARRLQTAILRPTATSDRICPALWSGSARTAGWR